MLECMGRLASEHPSAVNVSLGPKHCTSMQKQTFIPRIHHSDLEKARSCPFQSDRKSQDSMLNHCLLILENVAIILGIYSNQFKLIYPENQNHFGNILLHFQNVNKIQNILKKKLSLIAKVFLKLFTPKNVNN